MVWKRLAFIGWFVLAAFLVMPGGYAHEGWEELLTISGMVQVNRPDSISLADPAENRHPSDHDSSPPPAGGNHNGHSGEPVPSEQPDSNTTGGAEKHDAFSASQPEGSHGTDVNTDPGKSDESSPSPSSESQGTGDGQSGTDETSQTSNSNDSFPSTPPE